MINLSDGKMKGDKCLEIHKDLEILEKGETISGQRT